MSLSSSFPREEATIRSPLLSPQNPNLHARRGRSSRIIATEEKNINRQDAKSAKQSNPPRLTPRSLRSLRFAFKPKSSLALLAVKSSSPSIVPESPSRSHPARNPSPGPPPGAIPPGTRHPDLVPGPSRQESASGTQSRALPAKNTPSGRRPGAFPPPIDPRDGVLARFAPFCG